MKILFVCRDNKCISPMAELLTNDILSRYGMKDRLSAKSAGISAVKDSSISEDTVKFLKKKGYDVSPVKCRPLRREDYWRYDRILCMDRYDVWAAIRIFGTDIDGKVDFLLSPLEDECGLELKYPEETGIDQAYETVLKACRSLILSALM